MIVENFLLDAFVTKPKQHQQGAVRFSEVQLHWLPVSYRIVFVYKAITARLPLTRALEGFFSFGSDLRFGGRQSTVTMVFHALI